MKASFKHHVHQTLTDYKQERHRRDLPKKLPIYADDGEIVGWLRPVTKSAIDRPLEIALFAKWRDENSFAFPTQFPVTLQGTKRWTEQLIANPTRILFLVEADGRPIGHLGLYSFHFRDKRCEIDNVIKGDKNGPKGIMTAALFSLIDWTKHVLRPKHISLRVFSDNDRAIALYTRCGFIAVETIPLVKHVDGPTTSWENAPGLQNAEKYFLKMEYTNTL